METDESLLAAWRCGNRASGQRLFRRNFSVVHRFFVNKVDGDVEDLVQRTFVACLEGQTRFEGRSTFQTYLLGIAQHLVCDVYRQRGRQRQVDLERDSIVDLGAGPSTLMAEKREQRILLEALRRIPLKYQMVLELHYWEKLTGAQIGEILEIPANTAHARLRLAKDRLRRVLKQLNASRDLLESTDVDLERWAESVRSAFGPM